MNVFRALIASGKISTQTELRRYYRALAKQLHPDTSRPGSSDPAFVRLQQDYAEAQSQLHRNVQAI